MPVTRFEIKLRRALAGGAPFGDAGPYEELKGTLHFAVDPKHAADERITDVGLAPRNAEGRVEFAADVSVLLPVDRGRCNGHVVLLQGDREGLLSRGRALVAGRMPNGDLVRCRGSLTSAAAG